MQRKGILKTKGFKTRAVRSNARCQTYASNLNLSVHSNALTDWSSVELRIRSDGIQLGGEAFTGDLLYESKLYKPPKNVL
jgi:hypothetical protein